MSTVSSSTDPGHADDAEARDPVAGETWVALLHRPGPAAPQDTSLFADPRFGAHVQFLSRMREAGYLMAAGPLTDVPGEGMAILRLPGEGQFETAVRLATEDDPSVACGFFTVAVRPWRVILQASPAAQPAQHAQPAPRRAVRAGRSRVPRPAWPRCSACSSSLSWIQPTRQAAHR